MEKRSWMIVAERDHIGVVLAFSFSFSFPFLSSGNKKKTTGAQTVYQWSENEIMMMKNQSLKFMFLLLAKREIVSVGVKRSTRRLRDWGSGERGGEGSAETEMMPVGGSVLMTGD